MYLQRAHCLFHTHTHTRCVCSGTFPPNPSAPSSPCLWGLSGPAATRHSLVWPFITERCVCECVFSPTAMLLLSLRCVNKRLYSFHFCTSAKKEKEQKQERLDNVYSFGFSLQLFLTRRVLSHCSWVCLQRCWETHQVGSVEMWKRSGEDLQPQTPDITWSLTPVMDLTPGGVLSYRCCPEPCGFLPGKEAGLPA